MKVSLFVTCLTDTFYPRVGQAVVHVLEHFGCDVDFPDAQTCCGQPMFNTGCHSDAADLARKMIDVFAESDHVVTPSGSCCAMAHEYYPGLLQEDARYRDRVMPFVHKTHEFADFLLNVLKVDLAAAGAKLPEGVPTKTTYHYSCHLRGLHMTNEAVQLLNQIDGVDYAPLDKIDQCCGFGGTFAVKFPEVSGTLVRDKVACIQDTGADVLMCNDGGCAMNITGCLNREKVPVQTKHLAEIIAESLGLMESEKV